MAPQPFIVVVGATGQQGRSCIDALLQQKKFSVRGLTRDITRDITTKQAKNLDALGVELVQGGLNDNKSLLKVKAGSSVLV